MLFRKLFGLGLVLDLSFISFRLGSPSLKKATHSFGRINTFTVEGFLDDIFGFNDFILVNSRFI